MMWAYCTAAHADAPPARALARGGSRYHHRPTSPPLVVAVALLLAHGACTETRDAKGRTPLHIAAASGAAGLASAQLLLQAGAA